MDRIDSIRRWRLRICYTIGHTLLYKKRPLIFFRIFLTSLLMTGVFLDYLLNIAILLKTPVIEACPVPPATNQSHSDIFVFPKEFGSVLC